MSAPNESDIAVDYHPSVQTVRQLDHELDDPSLTLFYSYEAPEGVSAAAAIPGSLQTATYAHERTSRAYAHRSQEVNRIVIEARQHRLALALGHHARVEFMVHDSVIKDPLFVGAPDKEIVLANALRHMVDVVHARRARNDDRLRLRIIQQGRLSDAQWYGDKRLHGLVEFVMTERLDANLHPLRVVRLQDAGVTAAPSSSEYRRVSDWQQALNDYALNDDASLEFLSAAAERLFS